MAIGKIIHIVGLLFAIVAGLVTIPQAALVIAVVGLVGGHFIPEEDRILFLVVTIALLAVGGALGGIPQVGMYLTAVLTSLGTLLSAMAVTVIVTQIYEKVAP